MSQAYPNLIHPIVVEIEQIDYANTFYDEDTREPIQQAKRKTIATCPGQPKLRDVSRLTMEFGGRREESSGYVLFRKRDLDARSIELRLTDRIRKIGHLEVDYYINNLEWLGNLQNYSGPTLVKAWFSDKKPSKQRV